MNSAYRAGRVDLFWGAFIVSHCWEWLHFPRLSVYLTTPLFANCLILRRPRRLAVHDRYNAAPYSMPSDSLLLQTQEGTPVRVKVDTHSVH